MTFSFLPPLLILLAAGVYGLVHSWLASLEAKRQARRVLGENAAGHFYRLAYNIFAALSLLPILALAAFLPDRPLYRIPFPWALLCLSLQGLAALALMIGLLQTGLLDFLGLRQIFEPPSVQDETLVTGGLYSWMRHPLYTAGFVFMWLTPIMTANLAALYFSLSLYLVIGAHFEERKLLRQYGEAYRRYRQVTPMFIPRFPHKAFKV